MDRKKNKRRLALIWLVAVIVLAGGFHWWQSGRESGRLKQISGFIQEQARVNQLDPLLLQAVIWQESRYDWNAVGEKGEIGLMQLMDGAVSDWSRVTKQPKPSKAQLFDPETNIRIGAWYLTRSLRHWDGYTSQIILGLAEYNAGSRVADRWKPEDKKVLLKPSDISFPSTRSYIKSILRKRAQILRSKKK